MKPIIGRWETDPAIIGMLYGRMFYWAEEFFEEAYRYYSREAVFQEKSLKENYFAACFAAKGAAIQKDQRVYDREMQEKFRR